jgi:hypothetical protein
MTRIDELKQLRDIMLLARCDTKKKIFAYIMTTETAHYTLTCTKILVNLSKLQDKTIKGIRNILETDELRKDIDI